MERDSSSFPSLVLLHAPKLCLGWTDLMMLFTLFPGLESSSSGERLTHLESRAELVCISNISLNQTNAKDIAGQSATSPQAWIAGRTAAQPLTLPPMSFPLTLLLPTTAAVPTLARGKFRMTQTRTIQCIQTLIFYFQGQLRRNQTCDFKMNSR